MFSNLVIDMPWWLLLPVIATGLAYAGLLYVRNRNSKLGTGLRVLLFIVRFVAVSVLCFLLLSPFIKTKKKQIEKPIIVVGVDNSASMMLSKDSADIRKLLSDDLESVVNRLQKDYRVDVYTFGESVKKTAQPDFMEGSSDYATFITKVKSDYSGQNTGALVIAGDGISNRGIDPAFAASDLTFPVYTVALGDTTRQQDAVINNVRYNSLVYLGDDFPVELTVNAWQMAGTSGVLKLYAFGKLQASSKFRIGNPAYSKTFKFLINAEKPGKRRIRIMLETDAPEDISGNNTRNVFVDILDNRQKILLLANAPHPDLAAIRQSVLENKNFELDLFYNTEFKGSVKGYDLVILHQLPSLRHPEKRILEALKDENIPTLFILGKQGNTGLLNQYFKGHVFRTAGRNFENAQAVFNPDFSLFKLEPGIIGVLEKLPPLLVHLGNYQLNPAEAILAYQKVGSFTTGFPLVAFSVEGGNKNGFIAGEGLWLWRIHNYLITKDTKAFDEFFTKTIQLLMLRQDKRKFRVYTDGQYTINQKIIVRAELYNELFEPVNDEDVTFNLINEDGQKFEYLFSPIEQAYQLDLKQLPVGVYRYEAFTSPGKERMSARGEFVVSDESAENRNVKANHRLLYRLAEQHEGKMLYADGFVSIPELVREDQTIKSRIYFEEKFTGLNNLWWVIGAVLFLLSLEWFLRKYFGTY